MDSIKSIQDIFLDRLKEFAKINGCKITDVKILVFYNGKTKNTEFNEYINNSFSRKLVIKTDILGITKWDFLMKEQKLMFAIGILQGAFMEELKRIHGTCDKDELRVMIYSKEEENPFPIIERYKEGHRADRRIVTWEELEEIF